MSQTNSSSKVASQQITSAIEAPGYDADISSIGLRSMDTVSTSQGGYSADGEDKRPTDRVNHCRHAGQKSSQTIFASDDEEDENWSWILAQIDGEEANYHEHMSQSTVLLKHEVEEAIGLFPNERTKTPPAHCQSQASDMDFPSPPDISDWGSPLSGMLSNGRDATFTNTSARPRAEPSRPYDLENEPSLEETQTYSVHDPLEEGEDFDDGFDIDRFSNEDDDSGLEPSSPQEAETKKQESQQSEAVTQTQVYDMYDPLSQDEDEFADLIVPATMDSVGTINNNNVTTERQPVSHRQQSTLSMTWTLEEMNFTEHETAGTESRQDHEHYIQVKETKEEINNDYILYKGTQSLDSSPHTSQVFVEDISYVETSDTEEISNSIASIAGSQSSIDLHSNSQLHVMAVTKAVPSSQAIIQSTFPNSMDEFVDELSSPNRDNSDSTRRVLHEATQSSQQTSSPSSQRAKLSFARVIKSPTKDRKRSSAKLDDGATTDTATTHSSKANDVADRPPLPKRRPILGLAKPTPANTVRPTKSNPLNLPSASPVKVTKRFYGVNHRRKSAR